MVTSATSSGTENRTVQIRVSGRVEKVSAVFRMFVAFVVACFVIYFGRCGCNDLLLWVSVTVVIVGTDSSVTKKTIRNGDRFVFSIPTVVLRAVQVVTVVRFSVVFARPVLGAVTD